MKAILWTEQAAFYPMGRMQVVNCIEHTLGEAGITEHYKIGQDQGDIRSFLRDSQEGLWVLPGNAPLITSELFKHMKDANEKSNKKITYCSLGCGVGLYYINPKAQTNEMMTLFETSSNTGETIFATIQKQVSKEEIQEIIWDQKEDLLLIDSPITLARVSQIFRTRIHEKHMRQGVFILDPNQVYIDVDVEIGSGTIVYPGTYLQGRTTIGEKCQVGPNVRIQDSHIGNETRIEYSVMLESKVGTSSMIGPFAYIRPNSKIGSHVKIGDFVEIKNSTIGDYTSAAHLTYVGDADVGQHVNFGCGTITVNYNGEHKYRTTIEDDAFIGCNTNLVAPVTVKQGGFIAAGSTITKEVPSGALGIARAKQENIEHWRQKKEKKE